MEYFNIGMFDALTKDMYAPAYPIVAAQMLERTGGGHGTCLDIGAGCGYLAIALARISELRITLYDVAPEALRRAKHNVAAANLQDRLETLQGDVHNIPLPDNSMDLVVSRASMIFWSDMTRALREINRVLVPGGYAYIGGGFGTDALNKRMQQQREALHVDWHDLTKLIVRKYTPETLMEEVRKAGLTHARIFSEGGIWAMFSKEV